MLKWRLARWISFSITAEICANSVKVNQSLSCMYVCMTSSSICSVPQFHSPVAHLQLPEPSSWPLGILWPLQRGHRGHRAGAISSKSSVLQRKDGLWVSSSKTYITFNTGELGHLWTHCAHCRWLQHPTRKTSQELWFIWAIQMTTCLCSFSDCRVIFIWGVYLEFTNHSISPEWARITHL